ncbi:MAG: addiction module component, tigr02574 family protein [Alphaproteobacteria bacterium]|nr:addiction module component, tigr02574 family protein [Alphaproteobacteria bacterium]
MPTLTRDEITRLTLAERLALIGDLWDSMSDAELSTPHAQRLELRRRLASFKDDRAEGVSWEKLKAELAKRAP